MKKLAPGGTIDSLNEALNQEFANYNLKGEDEQKVRNALGQLRDYMAVPDGKSFSIDPVTKTYSVTGTGSEKFQGSPDEIKKHWLTGNLRLNDDKDVMSVAAAIYNSAKSKLPEETKTTTPKYKANIANLSEYITDKRFGDRAGFEYETKKWRDNKTIQSNVLSAASDLIKDFKSGMQNNPEEFDPDYMKNIAEVEDAIKNKDWDKFTKNSYKLGWSPNTFMLDDAQLSDINKEDQVKHAQDLSTKYGITNTTTLENLVKGEFFAHAPKFKSEELNADLKAKGILGFKNNKGIIVLIDPKTGEFYNRNESVDFFSPLAKFKSNWVNDWNRGLVYNAAAVNKLNFKDQYGHSQGIGLNAQGLNPGEKLYGWGNDKLEKLQLQLNNKTLGFATKDAHGNWLHPLTKTPINITGYSNINMQVNDYDELMPNLPKLEQSKIYDHRKAFSYLSKLLSEGDIEPQRGANAATALKWALINDNSIKNNPTLREQYRSLMSQVSDYLNTHKIEARNSDEFIEDNSAHTSMNTTPTWKKGGILKAQKGMTFEEYKKKYSSTVETKPQTKIKSQELKDISGTFKGQTKEDNILDAISTAGAVASFIPGVGVVGSSVSAAADLYKDLKDGHVDDWGTHLLNAGFIGLSAVGLGGVKSLVKIENLAAKSGKLAKLANFAAKTAGSSTVRNTARVAAMTPGLAAIPQIASNLEMFGGKGIEYSKPENFKNLFLAGAVGKTWATDALVKRAITRQALNSDFKPITAIKVGEHTIDINDVDLPKDKKGFLGMFKKSAEEKNVKSLEEFRSKISKAIDNQLGSKLKPEELSKLKEEVNTLTPSENNLISGYQKSSQKFTLGDKPKVVKGTNIDKRDFDLAKKYLDKYKVYYGQTIAPNKTTLSLPPNRDIYREKLNKFNDVVNSGNLNENELKVLNNKINKIKNANFLKEGGILKFHLGGTPENKVYDKNKRYEINPTNKNYLPYTPVKNLGSDWRFDQQGKYTPEYSNTISTLDDRWWNDNKSEIQNLVSDSNVKIPTLDRFKALALDYKPGRIHEWTSNKEKFNLPYLKAPIDNSIITPKPLGPLNINGSDSSSSSFNVPTKSTSKFNIPDLSEIITNTAGMITTDVANRKSGNEQRQAVAASMFTLPYYNRQNIRISAPYTLRGEEESGKMLSQTNRIAGATSDLNKAMSAQLTGASKASEIRNKYQMADQERIDKLENAQRDANAKVDAMNIQTLGQNRANAANAFKQIHLINSNETLNRAQNAVNYIKGLNQSYNKIKDEQGRVKLYEAYNDPTYKGHVESYNKLLAGEDAVKTAYDSEKAAWLKSHPSQSGELKYEDSNAYKNWQSKIDASKRILEPYNKKFESLNLAMNLGIPTGNIFNVIGYAKGGSLSKEDKIEIEKVKLESKRKQKDVELLYKSIMHDNDILNKSLIKVFK